MAPNIPPVPPDVETCAQQPTGRPEGKLTAGQVEKLWRTDRFRLAKVNGCFWRLICQYHEVRRDIGGVSDEHVCGGMPTDTAYDVPTEMELRQEYPSTKRRPRIPAEPPTVHPVRQKRLE